MADLKARIQLRKGTATQWSSANPILLAGEPGFETDTGKLRIGDGVTAWNSLPIAGSLAAQGVTVDAATLNSVPDKAPKAQPELTGPITIKGGSLDWTVTASGTTLTFSYNGVAKARLDSSGNLIVAGNITAFGTL